MPKSPEEYKTLIQFVKPQNVLDINSLSDKLPDSFFIEQNMYSKSNYKLIKVDVPEWFSASKFCYLMISSDDIFDMKPSKQAKHVTWVQLVYKTYMKDKDESLVPREIKICVKRRNKYEAIDIFIEELRLLHLDAVHRFK